MKNILIITSFFLISSFAFSQQTDSLKIFEAYCIKNNKPIKIKSTTLINIQVYNDTINGEIIEKSILGYLSTVSDSTITISPTNEYITIPYEQKTKYIEWNYEYKNDYLLQIEKNKIDIITKKRNYEPFGTLCGLAVCATIFSPLISYNFKNNTFNEDRFKKLALIGGITSITTMCIVIPLQDNPRQLKIK